MSLRDAKVLVGWLSAPVMVSLAVVCSGCGSGTPLGQVTGKVTYNGQPVEGIRVELTPVEGGRPSVGYTSATGEYRMQYTLQERGAPVGRHKVTLHAFPPPGSAPVPIPPEYGTKSEVEFEVKRGTNRLDVELSSE